MLVPYTVVMRGATLRASDSPGGLRLLEDVANDLIDSILPISI